MAICDLSGWQSIGSNAYLQERNAHFKPNPLAAVFFGGDPENPDTYAKFYADIQMFATGFNGADPESFLAGWVCDALPGPENQWLGGNVPRVCAEEYDALVAQMSKTAASKDRESLAREMNDFIVQNHFVIPLVWRANVSAHANSLLGVQMNPWSSELWNIADWHRGE